MAHLIALAISIASAGTPVLEHTYALGAELSHPKNNFYPQGLGVDAATSELLFAQQGSQVIVRTNLAGTVLGTVDLSGNINYTTSVAASADRYYYSDYTSNTGGPDLWSFPKTGGGNLQEGADIAAFGGYPIDIRGGKMYRTQVSNSYG